MNKSFKNLKKKYEIKSKFPEVFLRLSEGFCFFCFSVISDSPDQVLVLLGFSVTKKEDTNTNM